MVRTRGRGRLLATVTVIASLLSAAIAVPASHASAADGTASLSGTVDGYDSPAYGVSNATVWVYRDGAFVTNTNSDHRGAYTIAGLAPGEYDILTTYCCSAKAYISEWGDDTHGATQLAPTVLAEGQNTLDIVLDAGGYITGTVTGAGKNVHATMTLVPLEPIIPGLERRAWVGPDGLSTDPLPPGRYGIIAAAGGWLTEDHNGVKTTTPTEPAIVVERGATTSVAIELDPAGQISGTVYIDNRDGTRSPAAGARVGWTNLADYNNRWGSIVTDENGEYAIRGVNGQYVLSYSADETLPEYSGGSRTEEDAQVVTVRDNEIVDGIDATLDIGARIALRTTLASRPGRPPVYADTSHIEFARLDETTGRYTLVDPPGGRGSIDSPLTAYGPFTPGTYRVTACANDYIGAFFDWATVIVPYTATVSDISVTAGSTTTIGAVTLTTDYYDPVHPPDPEALPRDAGSFLSLAPARLLDTRVGTGAPAIAVGPGKSVDVQVTGRGGVPGSGVGAAVVNLTVTGATAGGFLTAGPTGQPQPNASNLNFGAGQTVANLSSVKVGAEGKITLTNNSAGTLHVIADIAGYHPSGVPSAPGTFETLRPKRILDTREGIGADWVPVPAHGSVDLQVTGRGAVAWSGVSAVVLNVTAVSPTAAGFLTVYPTGTAQPAASNLNFERGQTVPNLVTAKLGEGGRVTLTNNSAGSVHMLADVAGYYLDGEPATKGAFAALEPTRVLDTRVGNGASRVVVGANQTIDLQVTGRGGVPASDVSSVVMNLTVTGPTANGFLTAYPSGTSRPTASNLNFTAGQTLPNLVTVKVGDGGKVSLTNSSAGTVHLIADVAGYHLSADPPLG